MLSYLFVILAFLISAVTSKTEAEPILTRTDDPVEVGADNLGDTIKIGLAQLQKLILFFFLSGKNIIFQFFPEIDSSTMTVMAVGFVVWLWWRNNKRKRQRQFREEEYMD